MIKSPFSIVCLLLAIETVILFLDGDDRFKKYFRIIPHVFWIYFVPMVISSAGLIDAKSPVLGLITQYFLPASLFLLLLPVDLMAIMRLGAPAMLMMCAGSLGIVSGTIISFLIFHNIVGQKFWSGFGALCGSWTGGSANMIAVKEALKTPDNVFLPMVVVDTIVPYAWMGLLVALVGLQSLFNKWNQSDTGIMDDLKARMAQSPAAEKKAFQVIPAAALILLALLISISTQKIATFFPEIKDVLSQYSWVIIIVSFLGILASFTPLKKLEAIGASKMGYFLLYFVLTSFGAKANLTEITTAVPLIFAGVVILLVHLVVIIIAGRCLRAPMFLISVASQANVGGVASAPLIAELYQPGFASVGLLMAIFGNIIGTYVGILTAQLCRLFVGG
jgi:uncharacterized membrane protein